MATSSGSLDDLRRSLWRRIAPELKEALRGASDDQLHRAVEAPTAAGTVAELLAAFPVRVAVHAEWAAELLRGAERKRELLEEYGGAYGTREVADLLDVSSQAVLQRVRRGTLLALPLPEGTWAYPVVQFREGGVPARLGEVLAAFGETDPWIRFSILMSDDYGPGRLIDWLHEDRNVDEVIRIAASYGIQGAV